MSTVQSSYELAHEKMQQGQIADTTTCDVDSLRLARGDDVPFGVAVQTSQAASPDDREIEGGITLAADFRGIAVEDQRLPAANAGVYKVGNIVSVLWRGDIVVKVSAAVSAQDDVVVATTGSGAGATLEVEGQLSSKAANATHIAVGSAKFLTSAAAQGLAVVRIN